MDEEFDLEGLVEQPTLTQEQIEQLYLARYYYAYGIPFMEDTVYEGLMNLIRKYYPDNYLNNVHWSKDPEPVTLLHKYNLPFAEFNINKELEEAIPDYILDLKREYFENYEGRYGDTSQKSIELIQDYDTIYERVEAFGHRNLHISIKADGFNYTAIYFRGHLIHAQTKGRTGSPIDITAVLRLVLPLTIKTDELVVIISGELVCYKESLPYLRSKYKQKFVSTRSSVSSLLRGGLELQDIKTHLKPLAFKCRSEHLHTLTEEFEWLKENGFNTPTSLTFYYDEWKTLVQYIKFFEPYRELLPYSSDGLVLAVDDSNDFYSLGETDHHYGGNIAMKVGVWSPEYYVGSVVGIKWTLGSSMYSPEAVIEPVTVANGNNVTSIPLNHIGRMVKHNIYPGSEIYFKITGDTKITLVYKDEDLENIT